MASSKAMDLAQLMSLSSAFQPSMRAQAYQKSPKTTPIPQLVEASTHRSGLMDRHGLSKHEQSDLARTASHHHKLSMTDLGGGSVCMLIVHMSAGSSVCVVFTEVSLLPQLPQKLVLSFKCFALLQKEGTQMGNRVLRCR